jgi:hypothetical protein
MSAVLQRQACNINRCALLVPISAKKRSNLPNILLLELFLHEN